MSVLRNPFFDTSSSTAAGLEGPPGLTGPQGLQGIQGIQGEIGPQGPPGVGTWRGAWSIGTAYDVDDLVSYGGSAWVAIASGSGHQPDSSPTFWEVVAQKGDTGSTGATGAGVPTGGTVGQFLKKNSGTDFDAVWTFSPLLQMVSTETGEFDIGSTQIPLDDTIPQNTEGDQYMTLSITPKSATSKLVIEVVFNGSTNFPGGSTVTAALFQDTTANALAAVPVVLGQNFPGQISFRHVMTSGTTSATTFKVRAGANVAQTLTFNGFGGARKLGGVMASSIVIREYA